MASGILACHRARSRSPALQSLGITRRPPTPGYTASCVSMESWLVSPQTVSSFGENQACVGSTPEETVWMRWRRAMQRGPLTRGDLASPRGQGSLTPQPFPSSLPPSLPSFLPKEHLNPSTLPILLPPRPHPLPGPGLLSPSLALPAPRLSPHSPAQAHCIPSVLHCLSTSTDAPSPSASVQRQAQISPTWEESQPSAGSRVCQELC